MDLSIVLSFQSTKELITSGVPKGTILGPILLLVVLTTGVWQFVFADDITIVNKHKNCESLEVDTFIKVNRLPQYFEENKQKLNADKTNFVCIQTHQKKNSKLKCSFCGSEVG